MPSRWRTDGLETNPRLFPLSHDRTYSFEKNDESHWSYTRRHFVLIRLCPTSRIDTRRLAWEEKGSVFLELAS